MTEQGKTEEAGVFQEFSLKGEMKGIARNTVEEAETIQNVGTIRNTALPTKVGFWQKFKAFWLQEIDWNKEIKIVLTPKQQKIEDDINKFLHQEITWEKVHDFLFQEIRFGKK